jgi:hypothetical protein
MYDVKKDGRIYCVETGLLISSNVEGLFNSGCNDINGMVFDINYLYESRVSGLSIQEIKKALRNDREREK